MTTDVTIDAMKDVTIAMMMIATMMMTVVIGGIRSYTNFSCKTISCDKLACQ
jgi:hypothetical protein